MPTECMMRTGKSISRAEALRLSQETLERAERERIAQAEPSALDAARDAVVEASVKLYGVGGPFASRAYVEFRRWCESVAEYKRAQGGGEVTDYIVVADGELERSLEAFNVQPAPSALDAARDAVVEAACELHAARKQHDAIHAQPALSEKESRYAATLLHRIAHWSAALDAAVDEYKRSQEG